jgi:Fur family transcriptional regulator, ferric uptake regulator
VKHEQTHQDGHQLDAMTSRDAEGSSDREHDHDHEHEHAGHVDVHPGDDAVFRQQLRGSGQRVTPIRLAVMRVLSEGKTALDAQQVLEAVSKEGVTEADRVSVYRTLGMLVDQNLAHRIDAGDRTWRYKLTKHDHCHGGQHDHDHPHVVCDGCGLVECLTDAMISVVPRNKTAGKDGMSGLLAFRIRQQQVTLHGICAKCETKK